MAERWQCPDCRAWVAPTLPEHVCKGGYAVRVHAAGPLLHKPSEQMLRKLAAAIGAA